MTKKTTTQETNHKSKQSVWPSLGGLRVESPSLTGCEVSNKRREGVPVLRRRKRRRRVVLGEHRRTNQLK